MTVQISRVQECEQITWSELTAAERAEHDYLDTSDRQEEASFVRYRDWVYNTGEFMALDRNSPFPKGWQGYHGDSFFSGVLIKFDEDGEAILATYCA